MDTFNVRPLHIAFLAIFREFFFIPTSPHWKIAALSKNKRKIPKFDFEKKIYLAR